MRALILIAACIAATTGQAAGLAQSPARDLQIKRPAGALATLPAIAASADLVLKELLRDGYEIINIDAPVGEANARFILRKGNKIYSCDPVMFRSGGDEADIRVMATPCLDLTP